MTRQVLGFFYAVRGAVTLRMLLLESSVEALSLFVGDTRLSACS
jgi:hypothetical protein